VRLYSFGAWFDFEVRCVRDHVWIQKNLISPLRQRVRTTTRRDVEPLRPIQNPQFGGWENRFAVSAIDRPDPAAGIKTVRD
jgi:hypothetical protein